jgi:nucleoside recognition membrane protein YjiH
MKLSIGQKKELKGMLTFLVASIIVWLLASLLLHFPWEHTLVLAGLSIVISIIQTVFIVFRHNKKDE